MEVIRQQDGPDTCFYLDPPYLHEARQSTDVYAHEMTCNQHVELLNADGRRRIGIDSQSAHFKIILVGIYKRPLFLAKHSDVYARIFYADVCEVEIAGQIPDDFFNAGFICCIR